jgi:hypothetical protein
MILKSFLLVINCFGYKNDPNAYDLFMFGLGSFAIISILLFYYSKIPKSNFKENDIQTERKISRLPKMILYLSILIPIIILLVDFFNFGNLFTSFDIIMLSSITAFILYSNITPEIKKLIKRPELDNPIYQTKDILLQSNSTNVSFVITERTTSIWVKVIAFVLIFSIAFTPFQEFLGLYFI